MPSQPAGPTKGIAIQIRSFLHDKSEEAAALTRKLVLKSCLEVNIDPGPALLFSPGCALQSAGQEFCEALLLPVLST